MKNSKKIIVSIIILFLLLILAYYFLPQQKRVSINDRKKVLNNEKKIDQQKNQIESTIKIDSTTIIQKNSIPQKEKVIMQDVIIAKEKTELIIKTEEPSVDLTPNMARSIFHDFWVSYFAGAYKDKKINMDEGKKIVCLFNPKNEQEVEVAKSLSILLKNKEIPPVFSLFGNCGSDVVFAFYKKAGCNFPSTETSVDGFNDYLGEFKTPAIFYLWNGNIIKVFEGDGLNKFNAETMKKVCSEKYVPKKRKS